MPKLRKWENEYWPGYPKAPSGPAMIKNQLCAFFSLPGFLIPVIMPAGYPCAILMNGFAFDRIIIKPRHFLIKKRKETISRYRAAAFFGVGICCPITEIQYTEAHTIPIDAKRLNTRPVICC